MRDAAAIVATDDGELVWSGVLTDITERRAIEEALRASEERFRAVIETASDAFVSVDTAGRIVEWNRKAEETFGWTREEAIGLPLVATVVPEASREAHGRAFERFVRTGGGPVVNRTLEVNAMRRDGVEFPVELSVWMTLSQGTERVNAFVRDTSDRKALEAVTHQAFHDPLTNLANRALFRDRVAARARARGERDHEADRGAVHRPRRLQDRQRLARPRRRRRAARRRSATGCGRALRPADTAARLGGDEFAVLLEDVDDEGEPAARSPTGSCRCWRRRSRSTGKEVFVAREHRRSPSRRRRDARDARRR